MNLVWDKLTIRNAAAEDAEQLCLWWNDGSIMAHAGYPNGLNETPDKIRESLSNDTDEVHRRHIIELDSKPIGEMNYRNKGGGTAEIGIKICDFTKQEKGYGTILLTMFIDALFTYYGYDKIILDTNVKNKRAQHVYEKKLGFRNIGTRDNSWCNQLGELQYSIDFELTREKWFEVQRNTVQYIHLRVETPDDYYAVEEMTREAFWVFGDFNQKICDEHLLVHRLRKLPDFIPELDYIAEFDGKLAGHIIYSKSKVIDNAGIEHETLIFGPLTVMPEFQNKGIGKALMHHTFAEAKRIGYRGVIIFGHPDYYPRVGFKNAAEFGITTADGNNFDPFMAIPLYNGALDDICGRYFHDNVYNELTQHDALEFDKRFPMKKQFIPTPIDVLLNQLEPEAKSAFVGLGCKSLEDVRRISQRQISELNGIDSIAIKTIRTVLREHGYCWGKRE